MLLRLGSVRPILGDLRRFREVTRHRGSKFLLDVLRDRLPQSGGHDGNVVVKMDWYTHLDCFFSHEWKCSVQFLPSQEKTVRVVNQMILRHKT